jgi:hypothetical protein
MLNSRLNCVVIASIILCASFNLFAAVIEAKSCSQQDIQTAINTATNGDTVEMPKDTAIWKTMKAENPAIIINQKSVNLIGAGIGKTVIKDSTGGNWNEVLIRVDGVDNKPFRLSGFSIYTWDHENSDEIQVFGSCKTFRIDNIFADSVGYFITINDGSFGVIDHCSVFGHGAIVVNGDESKSWSSVSSIGTENAVFIENCFFDCTMYGNAIDARNGSVLVYRHSKMKSTWFEEHGYCCNLTRGARSYEIYNDTFIAVNSYNAGIGLRGGTGVVFNNIFYGYLKFKIEVENDRSCADRAYQGICGGDTTGYKSSWPRDGWQDSTGWPCRDQIGRGKDTGTKQISEPLYSWNNTDDAGKTILIELNMLCPEMAHHIHVNRDYYNNTPRPDYIPYRYPHPLTVSQIRPKGIGVK